MAHLSRIAQLAGKVESISGSAETLTAANATILAYDPVMDAEYEQFKRNPVVKHMSRFGSEPGARKMSLSFKAELMGPPSGSKGTALPISPFLRACGFSETLSVGVSNVYVPVSSNFVTTTIAKYEDGIRKTMLGCAGNVKFQFKVGEPVFCEFAMQGKYSEHSDQSILTPTYPSQVPFIFMGATVTISGASLVLDACEIDLQNEIVISPRPQDPSGIDYAKITGRNPIMTFDPELVAVSDHDFYALILSRATMSIVISMNDSNGNNILFALPAVRYTSLKEGDRGGIRIMNATCEICKNSDGGNDEIGITIGTSSSSSSSSSSTSSSSSSRSSSSSSTG
jgi:hypothetical protein